MKTCACGEPATVRMKSQGEVWACAHCASIVQMVLELMGENYRRGPLFTLIRGTVE